MKLPNRRPAETECLWFNGQRYHLAIGFDPRSCMPAEAFLSGAKAGSEMDALLDDAMICLSKLLQAGADPNELSATFGQQSIIGIVMRRIAEVATEYALAGAIEQAGEYIGLSREATSCRGR